MLILCYLFLTLMERAEARGFRECLRKQPDVKYRAISGQAFVVSCDVPPENSASIFNFSRLHESQLQWIWRSRDGGDPVLVRKETTNPRLQGNALWFNPITVQHSGTYVCKNRKSKCASIFIDVQTRKMANCSGSSVSNLNLLVLRKGSIPCPGKSCYSDFQPSEVNWYKNGLKVRLQKDKRPHLRFEDDSIVLYHVYDADNGTYVCDYTLTDNNTQWTMRTVVNVTIIAQDTLNRPEVLDPSGVRILEVELGQPLELKCRAQFGFELNASSLIQWYRETGERKQLLKQKWVNPKELEGSCFDLAFNLTNLTEEDLSSQFVCLAQNSIGNTTGVFRFKKRTERALHFLLTLCCSMTTVFLIFLGSMVVYRHWIEIVLLYRNYVAKDETVSNGKEFDAFVSCAKPDLPEAYHTLLDEETFALEILPQVLENKYEYKLCLTERDILPGGAYTDDIVNAIKKSRRAIVVLSPSYVNGPALFELETAVNTVLEDKAIKLILIQFKSFQQPQSLPHNVKIALRVLPRVTWKTSTSPTVDKQFWRKLLRHMPAKHPNGAEDKWRRFPPLWLLGTDKKNATAGRTNWTKKEEDLGKNFPKLKTCQERGCSSVLENMYQIQNLPKP
ncbi:LOW QUALITY PROTEIN: interleukin-18 receptor accessory protein [Zootoca vivipara]|uniref:LOW QUALITY PROTEIN: interleukin-18 receptor accessory protein n=1 Tax=Zootoca vivipara TaxID=8524 RepID=UPI00293B90CB|nr:LOW QUALITY PROTEIN: interleukin-18 receptor accessory protein [Zootoca vivipara]